MLGVDAALSAAQAGCVALGFELFDDGELRHIRHFSGLSRTSLPALPNLSAFSQMRFCQFANCDFANYGRIMARGNRIFAGPRLRQLRLDHRMDQATMADRKSTRLNSSH